MKSSAMRSGLRAALLLAALACARAEAIEPDQLATILRAEDTRDSAAVLPMAEAADLDLKLRALLAIGRIGRPAEGEILIKHLAADQPADIVARACFALGEMYDKDTMAVWGGSPDPAAVTAVRPLLGHAEAAVRATAAEALGKMADAESAPAVAANLGKLTGELDAAGAAEARACMTALYRMNAGDDLAGAIVVMTESPDEEMRAQACGVLGRLKLKAGRERCLALLADSDAQVRAQAAKALGSIGEPDDANAVAALLKDAEGAPRAEAIRAVPKLGGKDGMFQWREGFVAAATGPFSQREPWFEGRTRETNELTLWIETIGELEKSPRQVRILTSLRRFDNALGYAANVAMGKICGKRKEVEPFFVTIGELRILTREGVRFQAEALGATKSKRGEAELLRMGKGEGAPDDVRARMEFNRGAIVEALHECIKDDNPAGATQMALLGLAEDDMRVRAFCATKLKPRAAENAEIPAVVLDALLASFEKWKMEPEPDALQSIVEAVAPADPDYPQRKTILAAALESPHHTVRAAAMKALGLASPADFDKHLAARKPAGASIDPANPGSFHTKAAERAAKRVFARIDIEKRGILLLELFPQDAPITVANFVSLANRGYYKGQSFHRVVPNFVVQGGDPRDDMTGGPGYMIPCEVNTRTFGRGTVGMALSGKDTGGSQFFVCHAPQWHLDGGYTVFGQALESAAGTPVEKEAGAVRGLDILDEIVQFDRIKDVTVWEKAAP